MKHYSDKWIEEWCLRNGWSDLYVEQNQYWAFRPGAVMPEPVPNDILRSLKRENGLSSSEKWWSIRIFLTNYAISNSESLICSELCL